MSSENRDTIISFSQFSMWLNCPHRWELSYAKRLRSKESSVHAVYGTAMHRVLQENIQQIYDTGAPLNTMPELLFEYFHEEFTKELNKSGKLFSDPDELTDLYYDGVEIVNFIHSHWQDYYRPEEEMLNGIETPIDVYPDSSRPKLKFSAYIDVLGSTKTRTRITDIKTSKDGWDRYRVNDMSKISQLVLYRYFYGLQYDIPLNHIDACFFIVKRKPTTPSRVQILDNSYDEIYSKMVIDKFIGFINSGFDGEGNIIPDVSLPAVAGKTEGNCRFCEFKDRHDLCDPNKRKR